jgi:hypothetical protein
MGFYEVATKLSNLGGWRLPEGHYEVVSRTGTMCLSSRPKRVDSDREHKKFFYLKWPDLHY